MSQGGGGMGIVEPVGGVCEWRRITLFIETMVVIDFIVRRYIHEGAIVISFMGAVHEMGWTRVGLEVLRGVSLKQARELAKLKYWQHKYTIRLFSGGILFDDNGRNFT
ncbi:hypothetical protein [Bartonella grahamii]|uniref:hypothetical protein n=1 Tax=Bartonella grahamii TaxID=33045 RepID=UPI0004B5B182|nr:hypothetical protein [Bartonella grahamii]